MKKIFQSSLGRGLFLFVFAAAMTALSGAIFGASPDQMAFSGLLAVGLVNNRGRMINMVTGINGVGSGAQAIINLPVNQRYHRIVLNCTSGASVTDSVVDVIDTVTIFVNGIAVRTMTAASILKIANANGYIPKLGELPIFFTEPFPNSNTVKPPDQLSWDLQGQASFSIQLGLAVVATPGITGWYEFDFKRNAIPDGKGGLTPFLMPVGHREYSMPLVVGVNGITTIPFNYPIRRLWFSGSSAGNISQIQLTADGIEWFRATYDQAAQAYGQYGFKFAQSDFINWQNATGPADLSLYATLEPVGYFDMAFLSDPDGRFWNALKASQQLLIQVTSGAAQTLTVVSETLPGSFAG